MSFVAKALDVAQVENICRCAASVRLLRLVKRKVTMLCTFKVGFEKDQKNCLLLLVALPGLTDNLLHSCQLEGPCYDCCSEKST